MNPNPIAYRVSEIARMSGLTMDVIYSLVRAGVIPKLELPPDDPVVLVPAWCVHSFAVTGSWQHEEMKPELPKNDLFDDFDVDEL